MTMGLTIVLYLPLSSSGRNANTVPNPKTKY